MKKHLLVSLLLCSNILLGQSTNENNYSISADDKKIFLTTAEYNSFRVDNADTNSRIAFFYFTTGIAEPIAIGFGYQLNEDWAIALKWSGYWLSGGTFVPESGGGYGLKLSRRTHIKYINNLNFEMTPFLNASNDESKVFFKGFAFDLNIGNEQIKNCGIYFIWSVGLTASYARHTPPLFLPNIKIGFNINF